MATPEQINAARDAARHAARCNESAWRAIVHDTAALELARLRTLIRRVVMGALPMRVGWAVRDEDFDALREEVAE